MIDYSKLTDHEKSIWGVGKLARLQSVLDNVCCVSLETGKVLRNAWSELCRKFELGSGVHLMTAEKTFALADIYERHLTEYLETRGMRLVETDTGYSFQPISDPPQ